MTTDNKDNKLSIGSSDYAEILRHAVAVIEHARTEIARHVNGYVSTAYWEIGQMLHERKIESGYGDSVVRRLSADLKERYPKMGVSPRQLWNMKKFSSNPQPIGFSGILLAKRQNSFYCTYFLHNRNVADTKSPYPIKRLEVIRRFNQKDMAFNQSLS